MDEIAIAVGSGCVTPQRWARAKEIFAEAFDHASSERAAYLDAACQGDADLRAEVERMPAGSKEPSWESPAAQIAPQGRAEFTPGDVVAHYRIEALPRQIIRSVPGAID